MIALKVSNAFVFIGFRFLQVGDAKTELNVQPSQADSEVNGFSEELASFLFWSEDAHGGGGERERESESSAFMEDSEKRVGETECSGLMETHSDDDIYEDSEETEVHTDNSVLKKVESYVHEDGVESGTEQDGSGCIESGSAKSAIREDGEKDGGEVEGLVFMEIESDPLECGKKMDEDETESSVFMENGSGVHHDSMKKEEEEGTKRPVSVDADSDVHENIKKSDKVETESSVFMGSCSGVYEDGEKMDENKAEISVFMESGPNIHANSKKGEEEEAKEGGGGTEAPIFVETDIATSTSKCQYMSRKDTISRFIEEPTAMSFSFREFYMGPPCVLSVSDNACTDTKIIADTEFSVLDSEEEDSVAQEGTEDSVQEQVSKPSTTHIPFGFENEVFGGTDSSDEDDFLFNENSLASDSESESSSSSGLIWGNSNKVEDSIAYQFLGGKSVDEGFETEILKLIMREERIEGVEEKQSSCDGYIEIEPGKKDFKSLNAHDFGGVDCAKAVDKDQKEGAEHGEKACRNGLKKTEEARWEKELSESDSDEPYEDDFEWEHDDLVEQLKLELKNARQGGLATILEEEKEEEEEEEEEQEEKEEEVVMESPKVMVEDLEPLKTEEKLEYKDQVDEIEKVYKSYAEKMRKLDILNYQTMHALGENQINFISMFKFMQ